MNVRFVTLASMGKDLLVHKENKFNILFEYRNNYCIIKVMSKTVIINLNSNLYFLISCYG